MIDISASENGITIGVRVLPRSSKAGVAGEIGGLLKVGIIRPVIDKVFPFDQAKEALAYLEKRRAKGKVVVQIR